MKDKNKDIGMLQYLAGHKTRRANLHWLRLLFLQYLADWKSAIEHGSQISSVNWRIDQDKGLSRPVPFSEVDIFDEDAVSRLQYSDELQLLNLPISVLFSLEDHTTSLTEKDVGILDWVCTSFFDIDWPTLLLLVNSTYPLLSNPQDASDSNVAILNLRKLARRYRRLNK